MSKRSIIWTSRAVTVAIVAVSWGSIFWTPSSGLAWALEAIVRAYLMFLGTVMAHDAVHGLMGRSKSANLWWARIALLPSMVPATNFRRTHMLHHAHTNIPDKDPDFFMKHRSVLEVPFRALLMPHHWFFWLLKRNKIKRADVIDLVANYGLIVAVYIIPALFVGVERVIYAFAPALILCSLLLWYPFAARTHDGYSVGPEEERSHDYYGMLVYWFSLGLSMHRVHHLQPKLSWIELRAHVRSAPGRSWWQRVVPHRDVRPSVL